MKLFNIFKRKPKQAEQEQPVETPIEEKVLEEQAEQKVRGECQLCRELIYEGDRYSKQQGKYFHKKCFQQAKKMALGK